MSKYKFETPWESDYWMSSNGLYCGVNMPSAKSGEDIHSLPEYAKMKAYLTDEYHAVPKNWMQSEGRLASYFIGVLKGRGMWLDFNKNANHKHDVAIVISIQGVNPITGLPCTDPCLEQYIDNCPKCKEKFKANRYCEKCEMHWPKQNYICTTGQPNGELWLDGFKSAEGIIRQYIFTEDTVSKINGVASNIIGKDRVYAIGISYFLSKNPKPTIAPRAFNDGYTGHSLVERWHCCSGPITEKQLDNSQLISTRQTMDSNEVQTSGTLTGGKVYDYFCETSTPASRAAEAQYYKDHPEVAAQEKAEAEEWAKNNKSLLDDLSSSLSDPNQTMVTGHNFELDWHKKCGDPQSTVDRIGEVSDTAYGKPQFFSPLLDVNGKPQKDIDQMLAEHHMAVQRAKNLKAIDPNTGVKLKKVEVGAGAQINQRIYDDPHSLSYWQEEPEALIVINYGFSMEIETILDAGKRNKKIKQEGFLQGIPVGN